MYVPNLMPLRETYSLVRLLIKYEEPQGLEFFESYDVWQDGYKIYITLKMITIEHWINRTKTLKKIVGINIIEREADNATLKSEKTFNHLSFERIDISKNELIFKINAKEL